MMAFFPLKDVLIFAYHSGTRESEARRCLRVRDHPGLYSEFWAILPNELMPNNFIWCDFKPIECSLGIHSV